MSKPIIEVRNLSKRYQLGAIGATSLREEFSRYWDRVRGVPHRDAQEFWALRGISFDVHPGEVVGVIGRNGAGKSTLLKILSRITEPTSGRATLRGRVASLLEVGTGFHPELTGRQNVFLNGAILGMNRAEVRQKFDEIVAFAEVEQFIDTPVKRYSSGMYVRLAFAVAAHLEPEILIVDEVLAVGDSQFQKKCLGKMQSITSQGGRTIVFVSHDIAAVIALTKRCLFLNQGSVVNFGPTGETVTRYLDAGVKHELAYDGQRRTTDIPYIKGVELRTSDRPGIQSFGKKMEIVVTVNHPAPVAGACVSFQIVNQFQQPATHHWVLDALVPIARHAGSTVLVCTLPHVRLNVGNYSLRVSFSEPAGGVSFETLEAVCPFEVVRLGDTMPCGWRSDICVYHDDATWRVEPGLLSIKVPSRLP